MKLIVLLMCFVAQGVIAGECPPVSSELAGLIDTHTKKIRGTEYCKYRTIKSSNGIEVALYTVEGACFEQKGQRGTCGNAYSRYLTGIKNGIALTVLEADKSGNFMANDFEFKGDAIRVSGLEYGPEDARCCPSKKAHKTIKITATGFEPEAF